MRKILLSMLALGIAMTVSAYDFMAGGLAYNINADGTSVTVTYEQEPEYLGWFDELDADVYTPAYTNLNGALTIPGSVTNNGQTYSVTRIGKYAFQACLSLTSIAIPASVTVIENNPFDYCDALVGLTVDANNSVYDTRDNCNAIIAKQPVQVNNNGIAISYLENQVAFACNGSVIPATATSIGTYAFRACRTLKSLVVPEGITSIGMHAFVQCGIKSITLPSTLTEIGNAAFASCEGLTDVYACFDPANVTFVPNPYTHNYDTWQQTLMNPEWNHPINLHVYPQYVQWFENEYENNLNVSPWVSEGYTFNVMGDLGQKLYMHGSYNNWTDVEFVKNTEGKWELKDIQMPANAEFKLVDLDNNWYGATDNQYLITEGALGNVLNLVDGRNFSIAVAGTWTFTVDMDNKTLVVTGEATPPEPEHVYILGEVNDKSWAANDGVEMSTEDGVTYTADVNFDGRGNAGVNYFAFSTKLAENNNQEDWDYIYPYRFGAKSNGDYLFDDTQLGLVISLRPWGNENGQGHSIRISKGYYNLTVNLSAMNLVITKKAVLVGDINLDGKVDVTDVNIAVNIILGKDSADNYDGRADVDNSGNVDVTDVNAVVNIVLGKGISEE